MQRLTNPVPTFLDSRGDLLDAGQIYIGQPSQDPQSFPMQVYWDAALTKPAVQPLRTLGGVIVNGSTPSYVFFPDGDYSFRVRDADGNQVTYIPSAVAVAPTTASFQPLSANLTNLAAIVNTAFGRNLLTLSNQAALQAAVGYAPALPLTGGAVTGNITRSGAGVHTYFIDPAMNGGRIFVTAVGATDPTSLAGDIWLAF